MGFHRSRKTFTSAPNEENRVFTSRSLFTQICLRGWRSSHAESARHRYSRPFIARAALANLACMSIQTNPGTSPNRRTDCSRRHRAGTEAKLFIIPFAATQFRFGSRKCWHRSRPPAKLAGHTDSKSHARYSHHEIDAMRSAITTVPALPLWNPGSFRIGSQTGSRSSAR